MLLHPPLQIRRGFGYDRRDMKNLIVFDLDGTLAESKSAIDAEMAALLAGLLAVARWR